MLIGPGELVEERRLAAVLVSRQRECQLRALRQRMLRGGVVVAAALAQAGMLDMVVDPILLRARRFAFFASLRLTLRGFDLLFRRRADLDLIRVRDPQRKVISVDHQLHGISHRRVFHYFDRRSRDHAHIQKVLPQGARSAHFGHYGALADLHIFDCHCVSQPFIISWLFPL